MAELVLETGFVAARNHQTERGNHLIGSWLPLLSSERDTAVIMCLIRGCNDCE